MSESFLSNLVLQTMERKVYKDNSSCHPEPQDMNHLLKVPLSNL